MGIGNDVINDIEDLAVKKVLKSKNLFRFSDGENSFAYKFENEIGKMYDSNALLFPSATLALLSFIKYLKLEAGSEVIISPLSWVADYSVLRLESLKIIFSALDNDLNMIPEEVERNITKRTKMIIVVHLMGRKQKYIKNIKKIARKHKIMLVEDIAQSFGVGLSGERAGTYGHFAYSSLNHHKIISAGDGGFGLTNDSRILRGIQSIHDQGCWIKNGKRFRPELPSEGLSLRVNELTAAVAYSQVVKFNYIKRRIWKAYAEVKRLLKDKNLKEIKPSPGDIPFFYLFNSKSIRNHPSLRESGWHFAGNIPYLEKEFKVQAGKNAALRETERILANTYVIASGLIDKYYSAPLGLGMNFGKQDVKKLCNDLKKIL